MLCTQGGDENLRSALFPRGRPAGVGQTDLFVAPPPPSTRSLRRGRETRRSAPPARRTPSAAAKTVCEIILRRTGGQKPLCNDAGKDNGLRCCAGGRSLAPGDPVLLAPPAAGRNPNTNARLALASLVPARAHAVVSASDAPEQSGGRLPRFRRARVYEPSLPPRPPCLAITFYRPSAIAADLRGSQL